MIDTKSKSVLVVEDEALIACDFQHILETNGYRVIGPVSSATDALSLIEEDMPDLAVLDAGLGKATSFELADALLARKTKIIFVSGHSLEWFSTAHRNRRVLEKPFLPEHLVAAVEEEFRAASDCQRSGIAGGRNFGRIPNVTQQTGIAADASCSQSKWIDSDSTDHLPGAVASQSAAGRSAIWRGILPSGREDRMRILSRARTGISRRDNS